MQGFKPKTHATHRESFWRFFGLVALLISYFIYMSVKYDAATGAWVALLSWSFFVLCTPVADGGFIIAFPVRLLVGTRMVVTQIITWLIAIGLNFAALSLAPDAYANSPLTSLLKSILTTPWPYWFILLISAAGTFMSIWFGDEMMDVTTHAERHKHHTHGFKHKTLLILGLGILTVVAYYHLLSEFGIKIPDGS